MQFLLAGIFITFIILGFSCEEEEIKYIPTVQLTAEDASCTEVWLRLQVAEDIKERTLSIQRDGETIVTLSNAPIDTVIIDEGLLPKHTYQYSIQSMVDMNVTTMDTTSHNFTWQIEFLGDYYSSLDDIAIINDTLAYAVGEIHKRDSVDVEPQPFGLARWNGRTWTFIKVPYRIIPTMTRRYPGPLSAIIVFSENNILVGYGTLVMWYDGKNWSEEEYLFNIFTDTIRGTINKFWGISPSQIWGVGNNGTVFFYNGTIWKKLEKITSLDIFNIWGAYNPQRENYEILATASKSSNGERNIIQINDTIVQSISDYPITYSLSDVWFVPERHYYAIGDGIYEKRTLQDSSWKNRFFDITRYSMTSIHGNALNDVFTVGSFGELLHYNGVSWKSYINEGTGFNGAYGHIRVKGDLVIAVGLTSSQACVLIGRRQ